MTEPLKLGVLISGGGTTLKNLLDKIETGSLDAQVACVVSSTAAAKGLDFAKERLIPSRVFQAQNNDFRAFSQQICSFLEENQVDLVVLGGFLKLFFPSDRYKERCINIHPSLIPAFCGKGFYGMRVHQAVWERGCLVSGCTVHLVTEEYDAGPILLQKTVTLNTSDSPETIQAKVFQAECEALPEVIQMFAENRIQFKNGRPVVK